jgi:acetyl/propionyl-CoA carboxylase alpha subunit
MAWGARASGRWPVRSATNSAITSRQAATRRVEWEAGDAVVILEAMKMEQPLTAHKDGTVTGLAVEVGQTVAADTEICQIKDE